MRSRRRECMDIIRPVFTAKDLAQLPDDGKRYEILEGDLAVRPSPNQKHQNVIRHLSAFFIHVESHGYGRWYPAPFDVVFDDNNVTEPDLLFVLTEHLNIIKEANVQGPPDLVVEVLSPSTRDRDRGVKAHLYARFGVPEYWIVDPETETLTLYHLTSEGYEVTGPFRADETIHSTLFPDTPLNVSDVFLP
ncbi:MAG: Uma2 family endonuclease [Sulfobacillus thermosulfidooxidans]|nr:MAG: Uma2 family endonuclease [Sulfobacillus thermosulfidooxidans]